MTLESRAGASDRWLLYVAAFVRALATGMIGVLLGLYLASVGLSTSTIGIVVAAGLAGGAVATLIVTRRGDRLGRRRVLMTLALLSAAGAVAATFLRHPLALGLAAFVGMLNGMGRDRGPALALEQAVLPATATDDQRTRVIAWYNVLQDAGHAIGSLMAGLPVLLRGRLGMDEPESLRACLWLYAGLSALLLPVYLRLSPGIELQAHAAVVRLSRESKRILTRISGLFLLDALGGGFLTAALVSYFFFKRFGVGEGTIGLLFFGARVANAVSHLAAAWLAKRIGLVNTMVFTHIPSSILLATVAFAPTFPVAAVLFLLREGLVEMDVPTRTSYVMAVVRPEERTIASGVTSLVRLSGWAVAPSVAGVLMQVLSPGAPLFVGAGLKIAYDVLLYTAFRRLRPPEERTAPEPAAPR